MRSTAWFLVSAVVLAVASALPMESTTTSSSRPALCSQPVFRGSCPQIYHRFAFHPISGSCLEFIYGGCDGNDNNFKSLADCQAACPYDIPRPVYVPPKTPQDNKTPAQSTQQQTVVSQGSTVTNVNWDIASTPISTKPQDSVQRSTEATASADTVTTKSPSVVPTHKPNVLKDSPIIVAGQPKPTQTPALARNPPATPAINCEGVSCPNNDYLIAFYTELGCKPVFSAGNPCCAANYDCSTKKVMRADRCYHDNREYTIGQEVPESEQPKCGVHCKCEKANTEQFPRLRCVNIECAEVFNGAPAPGCKRQYTPEKCCSTNTICAAKNASEPVKQCDYEGKKYMEGERYFSARNPCLSCYCKKQQNGLLDTECQQSSCLLQYNSHLSIRQNCVPIFYKDTCCPIDYTCADDATPSVATTSTAAPTNIAVTLPAANTLSNNVCVFGARRFLIGETLPAEFGGACTRCKCVLPPHPTCVRNEEDCVKTDAN